MIIIIVILLCFATISDVDKHEVPLWVTPVGMGLQTVYYVLGLMFHVFTWYRIGLSILCGALLFLMMYLCVRFGNLGGADALLALLIGYSFSYYGLYIVLIAFLLALPYTIYMKITNTEHEYPFVPFLLTGCVFVTCFMIGAGIPDIWF